MNSRCLGGAASILLAFFLCSCRTVTATNESVSQPVMLGPVHRIGGGVRPAARSGDIVHFAGKASRRSTVTPYSSESASMPASGWDMGILSRLDTCNDCTIQVSEIEIKSKTFKLLMPIDSEHSCQIKGNIMDAGQGGTQ